MRYHVNEIKRLCDTSLRVSRRRRQQAKNWQQVNREIVAIILATLALTAVLVIAGIVGRWGLW